ncbi:hypothetical protein H5410_009591 [Solanum commersonii]|uniref:Aldehyde dehydrogenase domain-containing protein n=1 Tax=Solanum commersonii TaxID=4109 RepID=A0A9J6AIB1_SOLCO|nr:hypothetical protein H5410_009591 [Solanum commersonii]
MGVEQGPQIDTEQFEKILKYIKSGTERGLLLSLEGKNWVPRDSMSSLLSSQMSRITCFNIFDAAIPFGGYKMSGHVREKGVYSLSNYLQVKAIVTPLKNPTWL